MQTLEISTKGYTDIIEITDKVQEIIDKEKMKDGVCHLFVIGSTAALSTCEDDGNLYEDIKEVLEEMTPYGRDWKHHRTWHDDNGAAHVRATMFGPSLTVPVENGRLLLGTWQKIVLIDFDTGPRTRKITVTPISGNTDRSPGNKSN